MIKVNLLRNRGSHTQTSGTATDFEAESAIQFDTGIEAEGPNAFVKLAVMALATIGLITYEWYNIGQLQKEQASINTQLSAITAEIAQLQPQVEEAQKLQKEYLDFKNKINLIKDMGRVRLREIRAMDHLQNIIPEKAWFSRLAFEEGRFTAEGVAANDQVLDALLDGIRRHSAFKDVLLAKAIEQKTPQGTLKSFVITSNLGGQR